MYNTLQANKAKPIASSASVFHSMLSISGIATPYYADSLSVASKHLHSASRSYLNDHNQAVSLERAGLTTEDFQLLNHYHISY